jgi:hypothetical protein
MFGMPSLDPKAKPAETLRDAYQAADPRPLESGDPYFVDLTEGRDSKATERLKQMIQNSGGGHSSAIAFSGHRGSGKSTELRQLQHELANCYALYLDVNDFLDAADIDYTDLFLLVSRALLDRLRQDDVSIAADLVKAVEDWFVSVTKQTEQTVALSAGVTTEARAGVELPFIARLLAKLTADVKAGSSQKVATRMELDRYFSGLLTNTNLLLSAASDALARSRKPSQILILVDNLDRLPPSKSEDLFFAHGSQLQDLDCHAVYTMSIDTFYSHKNIGNVFPNHLVLPNVKLQVSKTNTGERKVGFDSLRNVIEKRVDVAKLLGSSELAVNLIATSGGSVRQLIRLLREAVLSAQSSKRDIIEASAVEDAARAMTLDFERMLAPEDYDLLAEVSATKRIRKNEQYMRLLSNTAVLEYNGKDFWQDVNPLIGPIDAFQKAKRKIGRPVHRRRSGK